MEFLGATQNVLTMVLLVAALGLKGFALVHALGVPTAAYPAAGKLTKLIWGAILGVAMAVQIILLSPLNFLNLLGVVAAVVYIVDVRPAVAQTRGTRGPRGTRGTRGDGPTHNGPYGPW